MTQEPRELRAAEMLDILNKRTGKPNSYVASYHARLKLKEEEKKQLGNKEELEEERREKQEKDKEKKESAAASSSGAAGSSVQHAQGTTLKRDRSDSEEEEESDPQKRGAPRRPRKRPARIGARNAQPHMKMTVGMSLALRGELKAVRPAGVGR